MLGRGLRRAPGKDNCLVLDFTDKQHKVDRIIDLRVLLPDDAFKTLDKDWQPPEQKDKARKLKLDKLKGGEMSVLADDVDPYDMAFVSNVLQATATCYVCQQGVQCPLACFLPVPSAVRLLGGLLCCCLAEMWSLQCAAGRAILAWLSGVHTRYRLP
jgi:hypothetical protein